MSIISDHIRTGSGHAVAGVIIACETGWFASDLLCENIDAGGPIDAPNFMPAGSLSVFMGRPDTTIFLRDGVPA